MGSSNTRMERKNICTYVFQRFYRGVEWGCWGSTTLFHWGGRRVPLRLQVFDLGGELTNPSPLESQVSCVHRGSKEEEHERRVHQGHDLSFNEAIFSSNGQGRVAHNQRIQEGTGRWQQIRCIVGILLLSHLFMVICACLRLHSHASDSLWSRTKFDEDRTRCGASCYGRRRWGQRQTNAVHCNYFISCNVYQ